VPFGLKQSVIDQICAVLAKYPQVEQAILYGSRALGTYKPGSDIDISLKGKGLSHSILNNITGEFDDSLLPYTFDVSIFHHISNPDLVKHIETVGIDLLLQL
jgi:predicted nucleotidyltransferase